MPQTPYDPPSAPVADPVHAASPKPTAVKRAVQCLWISVALTLVQGMPQLASAAPGAVVTIALTLVLTIGLLSLIAAKVGAGRSWARWVFLAIFLFGAVTLIATVLLTPQVFRTMPVLLQISEALQFVLQAGALILMFTPAAREWFRQ